MLSKLKLNWLNRWYSKQVKQCYTTCIFFFLCIFSAVLYCLSLCVCVCLCAGTGFWCAHITLYHFSANIASWSSLCDSFLWGGEEKREMKGWEYFKGKKERGRKWKLGQRVRQTRHNDERLQERQNLRTERGREKETDAWYRRERERLVATEKKQGER